MRICQEMQGTNRYTCTSCYCNLVVLFIYSIGPNKSNNTQLRASSFYLKRPTCTSNKTTRTSKQRKYMRFTRTYIVRNPPFYQKQKISQQMFMFTLMCMYNSFKYRINLVNVNLLRRLILGIQTLSEVHNWF